MCECVWVCVCAQSMKLPLYSVGPPHLIGNKRKTVFAVVFGDNECNNDNPEQTSFFTNHLKWIIHYKWFSMCLALYHHFQPIHLALFILIRTFLSLFIDRKSQFNLHTVFFCLPHYPSKTSDCVFIHSGKTQTTNVGDDVRKIQKGLWYRQQGKLIWKKREKDSIDCFKCEWKNWFRLKVKEYIPRSNINGFQHAQERNCGALAIDDNRCKQ